MYINILKVKKIPIWKFHWACVHVIWPFNIFISMPLEVTHRAPDFYEYFVLR